VAVHSQLIEPVERKQPNIDGKRRIEGPNMRASGIDLRLNNRRKIFPMKLGHRTPFLEHGERCSKSVWILWPGGAARFVAGYAVRLRLDSAGTLDKAYALKVTDNCPERSITQLESAFPANAPWKSALWPNSLGTF
jgi:hypothetical protein